MGAAARTGMDPPARAGAAPARPPLPPGGAAVRAATAGECGTAAGDGVKRRFRAKAPLRLSFAGGGTDVPPFPEREGGLVLSATINRYAYGALAPRDDSRIAVESADLGATADYADGDPLDYDGHLDLVKAAIRKLGRGGFDLFLHSGAPPGSGLGLSSTVIVTLIGLLKEYHGLALTDYEIAELAFTLEREDLGIQGGMQDQY